MTPPQTWSAEEAASFSLYLRGAYPGRYADEDIGGLAVHLQRAGLTMGDALHAVDTVVTEGRSFPPSAADLVAALGQYRARRHAQRTDAPKALERPRTPGWYPCMVVGAFLWTAATREREAGRRPPPADKAWWPFIRVAKDMDLHPAELCGDDPTYSQARYEQACNRMEAAWRDAGRPSLAGKALAVMAEGARL